MQAGWAVQSRFAGLSTPTSELQQRLGAALPVENVEVWRRLSAGLSGAIVCRPPRPSSRGAAGKGAHGSLSGATSIVLGQLDEA